MKNELESNNIQADLVNIEKDNIITGNYNKIIIGGPVYVERYPEILFKYIEKHLKGYSGKCMLFSSQANNDKNAVFQHALNRLKFLNITYCEFISMPNNFYNFGFKRIPKEEEFKIIKDSIKKSREAVNCFINDEEQYYPFSNFKVVLYNFVYNMFYKCFTHFLLKDIEVDFDKCVHCRLCEKRCPMSAVSISESSVNIKNKCLLCQRCMNSCPKGAFKYKGNEFIKYNPNFNEIRNSTSNHKISY